MELRRMDLLGALRPYAVRSARYQCVITPIISGATSNLLRFELTVRLDPPIEFSARKPLRRGDRIALPLAVIDREKFWQANSGEYAANLFKEVAIGKASGPNRSDSAGYVIDPQLGYVSVDGRRPVVTDLDYESKAAALFWKTPQGTIVKNPRIIPGQLEVTLKDPSGREESPAFQERRDRLLATIDSSSIHAHPGICRTHVDRRLFAQSLLAALLAKPPASIA